MGGDVLGQDNAGSPGSGGASPYLTSVEASKDEQSGFYELAVASHRCS